MSVKGRVLDVTVHGRHSRGEAGTCMDVYVHMDPHVPLFFCQTDENFALMKFVQGLPLSVKLNFRLETEG